MSKQKNLNENENTLIQNYDTKGHNNKKLNMGVAWIFDWESGGKPQITYNDVIRNFQEWNFRGDKDITERRSEAVA